jgi:hypothetical protein
MNPLILHPLNWRVGWSLILVGFLVGAGLGIFFHNEDFLGGYTAFRRRILRLGHIACIELGVINMVFSIAVAASESAAATLLVVGAITMPAICFLTTWKDPFRFLFAVPVLSLVGAVIFILIGGAQ